MLIPKAENKTANKQNIILHTMTQEVFHSVKTYNHKHDHRVHSSWQLTQNYTLSNTLKIKQWLHIHQKQNTG